VSTRRAFLQGCVAVASASASAAFGGSAGLEGARGSFWPDLAIFDMDFAEARSFAGVMRARAVATLGILGDITSLWYEDLHFRWRGRAAVIAGLTGRSSLFCLEQLAWDTGHQVVLRVSHTLATDGTVLHTFDRARGQLTGAVQPLDGCEDWGARMAAVLCCGTRGSESLPPAGPLRSPRRWSEPLVSWVIAHRSKV
jgi:hypothetical protein